MDNQAYIIDCEHNRGKRLEEEKCKPLPHNFEEAITLTGVGWFHYKLLLICGLCFMAVMVEIMGVSLIMNQMECDLKPTLEQQGILASAGFLGVVLSSHAMGFLADTWGRVVTLRYAVVLSVICSTISGFSVNIWMLIVFRFMTGFFISGCQACVFSLCGEFHGNGSRVRHVTLLSGFMCVAMMFAPSMAIGILPLQIHMFGMHISSWRILLIGDVSVSVLALVGLFIIPETPKYDLIQGKDELALETMRKMFAQNTGRPSSEFPVHRLILQSGKSGASLSNVHGFCDAVRLIWSQTVPLFYRSRVFHTLNICLIQFLIYGMAQGIFMWFPTILDVMGSRENGDSLMCTVLQSLPPANTTDVVGMEHEEICHIDVDVSTYELMVTIGGCFTVIFVIFAYTIDYIGKRNLIMGWMALTIISLVALHWVQIFVLVVICLTVTMAIGNCGGLVSTVAMEFYPTNINAMGMCFIMMVGRLGAVVGSNVLGRLFFSNCDTVLWALLALVILMSVMAFFLPEQRRKLSSLSTELPVSAAVTAPTTPILSVLSSSK
ncbi:synaptic vesicle 2-related protein [Drosophila willistoni]|nr:synaptic vesicle 2-related protein [Drosophila willistoni]